MIASDHISELAAAPPDVLTDSSWHSNEWSDCCSGRRLTAIVYFYTFLTFLNVFLFFFCDVFYIWDSPKDNIAAASVGIGFAV